MVLSDKTIREELDAGRIVIDPLGENCIQPSSVDLHVDRFFRVFLNHTQRVIDVKDDQENLTELVEVVGDDPFILHPGEFVLGSTQERVALPSDLVARLEGKSSLGRLGLLIHSSLPGSERVFIREGADVRLVEIGEVVTKRLAASVASFDPETLAVDFHPITGWYEGPADRIYEVRLATGRRVRVTAGHNLFTLDRHGRVQKVRTGELSEGALVAVPRHLPHHPPDVAELDLLSLAPEARYQDLLVRGPDIGQAFADHPELAGLLKASGRKHVDFYRARQQLPLGIARQIPGLLDSSAETSRIATKGARWSLPARIPVTDDFAWLIGLYVAEGYRRRNQLTVSNTDQAILDRAVAVFAELGVPAYRTTKAVTACSGILSELIGWLGAGDGAPNKRVPPVVFNWPRARIDAFLEGYIDGDGSREPTRTSLWTCSPGLVDDFLYLMTMLGRRASASFRQRSVHGLFQVTVPHREHKLLTSVPLADRLLVESRREVDLTQAEAAQLAGYRNATDLNNIERRCGRDAVRLETLRRLQSAYVAAGLEGELSERLSGLVDGGMAWDRVVEVRDTGISEPIYDIEVCPGGRKIENFVAGVGGVFLSNTAGFVDAGWDGHLTLELSNVANLPITIYPGMKIGQISFLRMTTPAEVPYGSKAVGSKYQGQRGPTPSRYYKNFES